MDDNKLKCPWCEEPLYIFEQKDDGWNISCENEDCPVQPSLADWHHTREKAIRIFCTRLIEDRLREIIKEKEKQECTHLKECALHADEIERLSKEISAFRAHERDHHPTEELT